MAGETPNAHKQQQQRKKLNWNEDRSTNKIYASGDRSAIGGGTVSDSVLKPGQKPVANPTPTQKADDKSADKYYANGGSDRRKFGKPQAAKLGGPPKLGVSQPRPKAAPAATVINSKEDINPVLEGVVTRLKDGVTGVVVSVAAGNNDLLKRTRAAMDLLVTRETITEDEYREVRLSYEPAAAKAAPPAPSGEAAADEAVDVDPADFLSGKSDVEEPAVDTAPAETTEVDASADVASSPAPEYPSAPAEPAADEDDGEEFLAPTAPTVEVRGDSTATEADEQKPEDPPAEAPASPGATTSPAPKPGRRSGRGSR